MVGPRCRRLSKLRRLPKEHEPTHPGLRGHSIRLLAGQVHRRYELSEIGCYVSSSIAKDVPFSNQPRRSSLIFAAAGRPFLQLIHVR